MNIAVKFVFKEELEHLDLIEVVEQSSMNIALASISWVLETNQCKSTKRITITF